MRQQSPRDGHGKCFQRRGRFDFVTGGHDVVRQCYRCAEAKYEITGIVEADQALAPACPASYELPDRQAVEEFIGEDDGGAGWDGVEIVCVVDFALEEAGALFLAEGGAGLNERDAYCVAEAGDGGACAQGVGHHHAAPGAELDQVTR